MGDANRKCHCFPLTTTGERGGVSHVQQKNQPTPGSPFLPIKIHSRVTLIANSTVYLQLLYIRNKEKWSKYKKERERWWLVSLSFTKTKEKETDARCSVHSPNAASVRYYRTDNAVTQQHFTWSLLHKLTNFAPQISEKKSETVIQKSTKATSIK